MFQTILTVISLTGNYLNCRKKRVCFILWIACNVGWVCVDFNAGSYSRMMLDAVQICFSFYGYKHWGKDKDFNSRAG